MFSRKNELYQNCLDKGSSAFNSANYHQALLEFTQAIKINPHHLAYYYRGQTHEKLLNYATAVLDYGEAESLGCKDINYYTRGLIYIQRLNQPKKALSDAITLFKKGVKDKCAEIVFYCLPKIAHGDLEGIEKKDLFNIIQTLEDFGHLEMAITYLEPCTIEDDNNRPPVSARFWKHDNSFTRPPCLERGTIRDICDYVQVKKPKLQTTQFAIKIGLEQFNKDQLEEAIATFDEVIADTPGCAAAFYHRGEVYHQMENHAKAIQDFCQAEKLGFQITSYKCVDSYAHQENYKEAVENALRIRRNGSEENGADIVDNCLLHVVHPYALNEVSRRDLFDFIKLLYPDRQIYFLRDILQRGPLSNLGNRFWDVRSLISPLPYSIKTDKLLREMHQYLCLIDRGFRFSAEQLEKMDELMEIESKIGQLRYHICWQKCGESKQELSDYYHNRRNHYQSSDITQYIEDFFYLGIDAAKDFAFWAIKEIIRDAKDLNFFVNSPFPSYLHQERYIEITTGGLTSQNHKMLMQADEKNYACYDKVWREYLEEERKRRNISYHDFKTDDHIEQLRFDICVAKNYERDVEEKLKELSDHYLQLTYRSEDGKRYIEDYVYLGISAAEGVVRQTLKERLKKLVHLDEPRSIQITKSIRFQSKNIFSSDCYIKISCNKDNYSAYVAMWNECTNQEKLDRNITNHDFKTEDSIQQLRYTICKNKNYKLHSDKEVQKLSDYYSPESVNHFTYQSDYKHEYIEDFLYLDITAAEELARHAIKEILRNCNNLDKIRSRFSPSSMRDNWIEFPVPSISSKDCRIFTCINRENFNTYQRLWTESLENEIRKRNVTNHEYKTDDPLEQLRFTLCFKKNKGEDYTAETVTLSQHYLLSPQEGGPVYQFDHKNKYLEDFLYLGIPEAEKFVRLFLEEELREFSDSNLQINFSTSNYCPYSYSHYFKGDQSGSCWIEFQAPSILSSGCKILTRTEPKNYESYCKLWQECMSNEKIDRNVTNHQYKTDDPLEQLRFTLCLKKNKGKDYAEEVIKISEYYLLPERNFTYNSDLYSRYREDFLYLDIDAAKTFLSEAIKDKLRSSKFEVSRIRYSGDSRDQGYIQFPGKLFSEGCTIKTLYPSHCKNWITYLDLWSKAESIEVRYRNVTNREFQSNDPIEQLRFSLCVKKNDGKDFTAEQEELSAHYEFLPEYGGFTYETKNAGRYYEDFLYLGIRSANRFVHHAIEEKELGLIGAVPLYRTIIFPDKFFSEGCKIYNVAYDSENYKIFSRMMLEYLTKTGSFDKKAEREYHYIGDPDDLDRIEYSRSDANNYVQDWLDGITAAENYVRRVIVEDFSRISTILEKLDNSAQYEKILDLICQYRVDIEDVQFIWLLKFKSQILKNQENREHAVILEEAFNVGVLSELIEHISKNPILSSKFDANVLCDIRHPDVLNQVAIHFSHQDKVKVAVILFEWANCCAVNSSKESNVGFQHCVNALKALKAHWDELSPQEENNPRNSNVEGYVILNQDITMDYYISSLLKNVDQLLDLAYNKNPRLFAELFCAEITSSEAYLDQRRDFYVELIQHKDMQAFSHYEKCKVALDSVFDCSPIAARPKLRTKALSESLTEFLNFRGGGNDKLASKTETSQPTFEL